MTSISTDPNIHELIAHEFPGRSNKRRQPDQPDYYADLIETMFGAFENFLPLCEIVTVVDRCRSDLAGSPPGAMPELLDRLARHRLSELVDAQ